MKLRDYQKKIATEACEILNRLKFVYISAEVRCGKTLMALEASRLFGAKNVLFVTKIKAISSVQGDYDKFGFSESFKITIVNTESLHTIIGELEVKVKAKMKELKDNKEKLEAYQKKIDEQKKTLDGFDLIISDEHHKYGAYPKPSGGQKLFKEKMQNKPVVCLSGTPSPESYSQLYHQLNLTKYAPFSNYPTFYKWAKDFVEVRQKKLPHGTINDYTRADRGKIFKIINGYFITYTQKQAGFTTTINEEILEVEMLPLTYSVIKKLEKDKVIQGDNDVILADTGVKLMQKVHQLYSGTVKFESGESIVLDYSKASFIKQKFQGKKIVIFYKFKAELDALKSVFKDYLTTDLNEFNASEKSIALQIVSGREGINLSKASAIVYYNIDFSAVSYWQSRDRMTTIDRIDSKVYWIFAKGGIEHEIYKTVANKKDFTLSIYKQ